MVMAFALVLKSGISNYLYFPTSALHSTRLTSIPPPYRRPDSASKEDSLQRSALFHVEYSV